MGTEIFIFETLEPEKMRFKDGNPIFRDMTKQFSSGLGFLAILSNGHPCTLPIQFLKSSHNKGMKKLSQQITI